MSENIPTSYTPGYEIPEGSVLEQFIREAQAFTAEERRTVAQEWGSDDYSIVGMAVVGSIAAGTEDQGEKESDIDVILVTKEAKDIDVSRFAREMGRVMDRSIEVFQVIQTDYDEDVDQIDFNEATDPDDPKKGQYTTAIHFVPLALEKV